MADQVSPSLPEDGPDPGSSPGVADRLADRLVDLAPTLTFVVDGLGMITHVRGNVTMVGYEAEELVGTEVLTHVDLDWDPLALDSIGAAFVNSGLQRPMLFRIRRKDGSPLLVEATANSQLDDPVVDGLAVYLRRCNEQWLIDRVVEAIAGSAPLAETLGLLVEVMGAETLEADGVVLYDDGTGVRRQVSSPSVGSTQRGDERVVGGAPWDVAIREGRPVQVRVTDLAPELAAEARANGHAACWAWPVVTSNGPPACLVLWRHDEEEADHTCRQAAERLVRLTGLMLERERTAAATLFAATHDALTGLANRARFFQDLQTAIDDPGSGPMVGVLYIDLDGFKPINDRYGHGAGDQVLREVARRLEVVVRPDDRVCRMGGDEFTVLAPRVSSSAVLEQIADRVLRDLRDPIALGDFSVSVGASVGIALASPGTCSIDVLVDAADAALYQVKHGDKGGWHLADHL